MVFWYRCGIEYDLVILFTVFQQAYFGWTEWHLGFHLAKYLPPQPQRWSVLSTLQIRASENNSHYRFIEYNNQKKTVKTLGHCMLSIYTSATILHMLILNCHCFPKILWQCWLLKNKFIYKHNFFLIWFQLIFWVFLRKMVKRQKGHIFVSYAGFVTA